MNYSYAADKQILEEEEVGDVVRNTSFRANYDGGNCLIAWSRCDNAQLSNQTYDDPYNAADGITNRAGNDTEQDLKGNLTE